MKKTSGVVPGKNGDTFSRKGATIVREDFGNFKDEYYGLRGWDVESGLATEKRFRNLDLAGLKAVDLLY